MGIMTEVLEVAAEVAVEVVVEVVVAAAITVIKMATLLENALRGVMMGVTTTVIKQDKNLQVIQNNKKENQRKKKLSMNRLEPCCVSYAVCLLLSLNVTHLKAL